MKSTRYNTFYNTIGYLVFMLLFLVILISPHPTEANNLLTMKPEDEIPEFKPGEPDPAELLPRLMGLSTRRIDLEKMLMTLPDVSKVKASIVHTQSQIQASQAYLERIKTLKVSAKRQLTGIHIDLQNERAKFNRVIDNLGQTFTKLETQRRYWIGEKRQWESWQDSMPEPERKELGLDPLFAKAKENYQSALDKIAEKRVLFLPVQRQVMDVQNDIGLLEMDIARTRMKWKADASQQTISPPLFTRQYFQQYNRQLLEEARWGWKGTTLPGMKFLKQEIWVVGGQLVLMFFLVWVIFRFRSYIDQRFPDHFFTRRPYATGLFVSLNLLAPWYQSADPFLHLVLAIVIGFSGARLAPGFAARKYGVRVLYIVVVLVVLSSLLPLLGTPLPIVRLCVLGGALLILALCIWLFVTEFKTEKSTLRLWAVGVSAFLMGVVVLLEIIGESAWADYLFFAVIETSFLVFVAWMLMVMAQNAVELFCRSHTVQKIEYLRGKIDVMIRRTVLVIRLVIGFVMVSYIMETLSWAESTSEAMGAVFSLGISIGTFRLTVGLGVAVVACFFGSIVVSYAIQALLSETTYKKHDLQLGVRVSISKIIHYVFVLAGFLLVLKLLGVEMKSITIIGGALGVGIGFGLQGIAKNFIAGIILLFERPIKVGDYVTMEGQWGEIKRLGLRSTVVQTFDYSEIVVPNHDLIEYKVVNWTLSDRLMRIIVKVGVAYGSDVERVKQILEDCAMASSKVTRSPAPQTLFMKFGESSLNFELRVWITNIDDYVHVTSFLHEEIDKRFRKEGIVIAFPQRDLHMKTDG